MKNRLTYRAHVTRLRMRSPSFNCTFVSIVISLRLRAQVAPLRQQHAQSAAGRDWRRASS